MNGEATRLAKLTRPAGRAAFARTRLFDLLDQHQHSPVLWIAGPPGAGKTTLIADYTARRGLNGLWYQVDRGDADVASSFYYLGEAARAHGRKAPLPPFEPSYLGDIEAFARGFFRELFHSDAPYLVFDNYQTLRSDAFDHNIVLMAMNELPVGGRIFVVSRTNPPASFASVRARGHMSVVGWNELRLSREECAGLAAARGIAISDDELGELHGRTQGWAAGMVLLLQGLRRRLAPQPGTAPPAPTVIFDYLAEEIFAKFPPAVQEFLLRAAYLPQVTPGMAGALGPGAEVREALREITTTEFLVTLVQREPQLVFQFHPLLREFLLARAEETGSAAQVQARRQTVAEVLAEHGYPEEAAALYIRNLDWSGLTRIIRQMADTLLEHGRTQTLQRWIEALPAGYATRDPWLEYWLGAARYPYEPREAVELFAEAYRKFSTASPVDVRGAVSALNSLVEAIVCDANDFRLLDQWIAEAPTWPRALREHPAPGLEARFTGNVFVAMALRQPQHPDLPAWRDRATAMLQTSTDPNVQVSLCAALTALAAWIGQFARVEPLLGTMAQMLQRPEISPVNATKAAQAESMYYMLAGDRARCVDASLRGMGIVERTGVRIWNDTFLINAVCGALAESDLASAATFLQQLEARPTTERKFDAALRAHAAAWFAMLQGDAFLAHQQLKLAVRTADELGLPFFQVIAGIGLAQVLYDNGDERGAQAELSRALQVAGTMRNRLLDFTMYMCRAQMATRRGMDSEALQLLRAGLEIGRERGLMHFPWWQPRRVALLCQQALAMDIEPEYVRRLILQRRLMPERPPYQLASWPWRYRIGTFGNFRLTRAGDGGGTGKRGGRPYELLKVLVAQGGESVRLDRAAEALWPHVDNDYALKSLTTTLHRLRKEFAEEDALLVADGELSLNRLYFWLDTWAFEQACDEVFGGLASGAPRSAEWIIDAARAALAHYHGPLLADSEASWTVAPRERYRALLQRLLNTVGSALEKQGRTEDALALHRHALELDPLCEALHRRLMLLLKNAGRMSEAVEAYQRCRTLFKAETNAEPSAATQELYRSLQPDAPAVSSRPLPAGKQTVSPG